MAFVGHDEAQAGAIPASSLLIQRSHLSTPFPDELIIIIPLITLLGPLEKMAFYLADKTLTEIFLELYFFVRHAMRIDEYYNVVYDADELCQCLKRYQHHLFNQYETNYINLSDKQQIKNVVEILNEIEV